MQPLTYPMLRDAMHKQLEAANPGGFKQSLSNLNTALTQYLAGLAIPAEAAVGVEFRVSFYKLVDRHLAVLRTSGRSEQAIRDRKSLLKKWRTLFIQLDKEHSAASRTPTPFLGALLAALPKGVTLRLLAEQVGIPLFTLKGWKAGRMPRRQSVPALRRLERFLALSPGHLTDFLLAAGPREPVVQASGETIPYREALKGLLAERYRLSTASDTLKAEWADLLHYKTAPLAFGMARQTRGRWTPSPLGSTPTEMQKHWFAVTTDGQYVPTAHFVWGFVSSFMGWLIKHGGQPTVTQTLGLLSDLDLIHKFLAWYLKRSGNKVHGGHLGFVRFILMLNHPKTGYLTQEPKLGNSLEVPVSEPEWRQRCAAVYETLKEQKKALERTARPARDPNAPVAAVTQLPDPMLALKDMMARLRASRPTAGTYSEAIWGRDIVLLGILIRSPLRAKNLKHLSYRPDGTGSLRRSHDGTWQLHIPKEHFKNRDGAAAEREYRIDLDLAVSRDIDAYIQVFRPMILRGNTATTDILFVSQSSGSNNLPWRSLNRHVEALTARYLMQCPGVGPHAFRHIVATAIVKTSGESDTAALVLHDKEATIKKNYSHLRSQDGHTRYHNMFPGMFSE